MPEEKESAELVRQRSGELLRVVLVKMGTHADSYEPLSYAVWYEYVRGGTPKLQEDVDLLLVEPRRLTAAETQLLFNKYLRSQPEAAFANARVGLLAVLAQLQNTITQAARNSGSYGDELDSFGSALTQSSSLAGIHDRLTSVVEHTEEMRSSMTVINDELQENRGEVSRLSEELGKLREDVLTDPLTGLANRRGFDLAIAHLREAADRGEQPFSIVMIDIDHFKTINDTHGHLVGDRVIQQVASTLKSCVRGGDTAARYGGEEFALLLPATSKQGALTVAEYVRNTLQRAQIRTLKQGISVGSVTVSAGIALYRVGEETEECVRRADQALYASKHAGRNRSTTAA